MKYLFRDGCRISGDPDKIGKEFERIEELYGELKAEHIVKEAKKKTSILHNYFTWDISQAAIKCWLEEAKYIIRQVCIVEEGNDDVIVRAYHSIFNDDKERSYIKVGKIMNDDDLRGKLFELGKQEIYQWKQKYKKLAEFAKIYVAIEETF